MQFVSKKRIAKVVLLALFVACVGLWLTTGQAFASASHSGCDAHNSWGCSEDEETGYTPDTGNASNNCDAWDPNTGYCTHWEIDIPHDQISNNCDAWDPNTGYCTHWRLDFSSSY